MPRNGSGNYSKVNTFVDGTPVLATPHNQNWDDIATAMTNSVAKNGETQMTAPLKHSSGSASLPSVTFATDTDTGFFRKAANTIGVAVGGVEVASFDSLGVSIPSYQGFFPEKYSAVGNGSTDDRTSLFNCDAAAATAGQCVILSKVYAVAAALTFTAPVLFMPGARLKPGAGITVTFNHSVNCAPGEQIFDLGAPSSSVSPAKIITPYVTPQMFGAAGDGITDDSSVFQKIIDTFAGKKLPLFIPPNTPFNFNNRVEIKSSFLNIYGAGTCSRIINTGNHDAFAFTNTSSIEHVEFRDFQIAGPSDSVFATDGYGIRFLAPSNIYPVIRGMTFRSLFGGVAVDLSGATVDGTTTVNSLTIEDTVFRTCKVRAMFFSFLTGLTLEHVETQMFDTLSTSACIQVSKWVQDVRGVNVVNLSGGYSLLAENGGSRSPSELKFSESVFDGAGTTNIQINQGDRISFSQSWIGSPQPGASAVVLDAQANRISIDDCDIVNTARYGFIAFAGAKFFSIKDSRVYNCSLDTANTYDAINIAADVSNFSITGNEIYNSVDFNGLQRYGIFLNAGASDNYMISNNCLRGNQTGGLSDGGTGLNKVVSDNLT